MEYLLYLGFLLAIGCWLAAAAYLLAAGSHIRPGKHLMLLFDPVVWWNPTVAGYYLTNRGLALFKQAKLWLLRFLGMLVILAALLIWIAV